MSYIFWDPSPYVFDFNLPLLNRPILWYGFFFALGFFLAYLVLLNLLRKEFSSIEAKRLTEKLTLYVVVGTVLGARLGDLFFYQDWQTLLHNPSLVFRIWEGGLASHGGAAGILIALCLFVKKEKKIGLLPLIDRIALCSGVVAGCIRLGNFVNQELLGIPTTLPWGVIFGHPADGSLPTPRHPVQLYESVFYFFLFFLLKFLWKNYPKLHLPGKISGIFILLVFGFRFFVEFIKEEASPYLPLHAPLDMAQYLSVPFIALGIFLLVWKRKKAIKK